MSDKQASSIWFREFSDGDSEIGILEEYSWGYFMDVGGFGYYFGLDLNKWTRVGEL